MLYLHIFAGSAALISGVIALGARKGGWLHRRGGMVFVRTMLFMALSGAGLAWFKDKPVSMLGGLVTTYFVLTAWLTVRKETPRSRLWQMLGMLLGAGIGGWALSVALAGPSRPAFVVFGAITLAAVLLDVRLLLGGRLNAAHRLARHLWRMGFALLLATVSLFLGQSQVFPEAIRRTELLMLPVVAVVLVIAYWLVKVLAVRRKARATVRAGMPRRLAAVRSGEDG